jgi:hypothetical protein
MLKIGVFLDKKVHSSQYVHFISARIFLWFWEDVIVEKNYSGHIGSCDLVVMSRHVFISRPGVVRY